MTETQAMSGTAGAPANPAERDAEERRFCDRPRGRWPCGGPR